MNVLLSWLKDIFKVNPELMAIGSTIAAGLSFTLGGFDTPVIALCILVVLDFVTGVCASSGSIDSTKMSFGIVRKVAIFVVIGFAYLLDCAMQINMLRSMAIFGYALNEALSIIENIDKLGYGHFIPSFFRNKLERLKDKSEKG